MLCLTGNSLKVYIWNNNKNNMRSHLSELTQIWRELVNCSLPYCVKLCAVQSQCRFMISSPPQWMWRTNSIQIDASCLQAGATIQADMQLLRAVWCLGWSDNWRFCEITFEIVVLFWMAPHNHHVGLLNYLLITVWIRYKEWCHIRKKTIQHLENGNNFEHWHPNTQLWPVLLQLVMGTLNVKVVAASNGMGQPCFPPKNTYTGKGQDFNKVVLHRIIISP